RADPAGPGELVLVLPEALLETLPPGLLDLPPQDSDRPASEGDPPQLPFCSADSLPPGRPASDWSVTEIQLDFLPPDQFFSDAGVLVGWEGDAPHATFETAIQLPGEHPTTIVGQ